MVVNKAFLGSKFKFEELFGLSIFILPVVLINATKLIVPSIIFLLISAIPHVKKPRLSEISILPFLIIGFYFLHVVGMFFTENVSYGAKDLETKFSFLLFPLLFIFTHRSITSKVVYMGKMGLVIGSFLAIFLSYIMAVNCLLRHGELCFTSVNFGFQMHSTYLSLIYIMALLLVLTDSKVFSGKFWMKTCYSIVVFSAIILLGSLSSVICVFILSCLFLVKFLRKIQNVRLRFLAVLLLLTSVFGTLQIDRIGKEVDYTRYVLKDFLKNPDEFIFKHQEDRKSSMVRMALYNFSFDVMKEHPMGVGTGDVKDVLNKKYTEYGYNYFVKEKLNPHSQFFQTGIAFGIFGVMYLLFLLFYPILYHKRFEDANLFYFAIIIFITCLFESFLERQVGVIITCFIFTFFISIKSKEPTGSLNS